jgi:hypothetical protein
VGVSRGTVERALEAARPSRYDRMPTGSMFDAYQAKVRTDIPPVDWRIRNYGLSAPMGRT